VHSGGVTSIICKEETVKITSKFLHYSLQVMAALSFVSFFFSISFREKPVAGATGAAAGNLELVRASCAKE